MKVAQLTTRYPPAPGGVERHVVELAPRLAARRHRIEVYTSELYREFPWERLAPDVPREETTAYGAIHRLRVWSMPGELHYTFFRGLHAALDRDRPEIVHAHTYGTHQVAIARRHYRRHGTPYVLTAHFHPIWSIEGGWMRRRIRAFYDGWLAAPAVRDARALIVQTRAEEQLVRSLGFSLPPTIIVPPGYSPRGADLADPAIFRTRFGIPDPFVLFVGRLASNKGLLDLLEAFALLARRDRTAQLVLIGEDGGMRASLSDRARELGLGARLHLLGHVGDPQLVDSAYRGARVFVLPSEYEAFGLVLLEALAQGAPVVATRVGGIPEVLGEDERAGMLVEPGSAEVLAEQIGRLWDDPTLGRQLGEYGRRTIVPRYSWDALADRLDALYREIVPG